MVQIKSDRSEVVKKYTKCSFIDHTDIALVCQYSFVSFELFFFLMLSNLCRYISFGFKVRTTKELEMTHLTS